MGLNVIFFGTPGPAAESLSALLASDHSVISVVTAPDRPRGRGMELHPSEVKALAIDSGIEVLQPSSLRNEETQKALMDRGADAFVVTAYGMILPKAVLEIPRLGCLNTHFSLLPKFRGAAPIQWALLERHTLTGVTVMRMDEGLDTGPILAQLEEPILAGDTAGTLGQRLSSKGSEILVKVLDLLVNEPLDGHPQPSDEATLAPKLSPADARLDWSSDAEALEAKVRAMDPKPGSWTTFRQKRLKVWRAQISADVSAGPPGSIGVSQEWLSVTTATQSLLLKEVHPEGSSRMSAAEFIRGYRPQTGEVLS